MRKAGMIGIAMAAAATAGCHSSRAEDGGPTVQKSFPVGAFDKLEVAGPYDVTVRTGANPSVSASGPQKILDRLVVEVKGDKLVIHTQEHHGMFNWGFRSNGSAKLDVTVPALSRAVIAGSGGITVDKIAGESFDGAVAGAGDLNLDSVQVKSLKLAIGGSGDIRARTGQAQDAEYHIAGSGDLDASGLQVQAATVAIMGSGSIKGQATGAADVKIMGAGDVTLTGGAKCSISKMGAGDVNCS